MSYEHVRRSVSLIIRLVSVSFGQLQTVLHGYRDSTLLPRLGRVQQGTDQQRLYRPNSKN